MSTVKTSDKYATPPELFNTLDNEFSFTLDVCAEHATTKVPNNYYTEKDNALSKDWGNNVCWMNPPYSTTLNKLFIKKAIEESQKGATVVALVRASVGSQWFKEAIKVAHEVRFITGRIRFIDPLTREATQGSGKFDSVILVFRPPLYDGHKYALDVSWTPREDLLKAS